MKFISLVYLFLMINCAHVPKCGYPEGSKVVLEGKTNCLVRIRQVEIGSDLKIPDSLKNPDLVLLELTWVDPIFANGQIELGHFKLIPKNIKTSKVGTE